MPIERKFNMQQRIADGGFYTGPNFSTHQEHADLTSLPDSTVFSNPTVKFVRYGLGREDVPYTQGMYNSLLGEPSFQSSEDKEKKEFPPRVNALFRRVSDALYDHYGVAVRIGGVGKEGDDVRDIDVRFLPEDQLRDFSQEYNHQEYLLSNLPPIARAALVVRGVPYAVATPTVNTIAFSEKRYLSPLKKGGKLSDQDKIEMTQSAVEMLRFLVPSIVQLLPDRHRVDKIPEPLLKMIFDPKDGELTKKLNYAIQRAGHLHLQVRLWI